MASRALLGLLLAAAAASAAEILNDKVAVIDPFPREVLRGKTLVLTGSLKGAFRGPELILIAPGGKTYLNRDNVITGGAFTFTVRFDEGVGPYRLELIATNATATRTAARFTVWYGQKQPAEEVEEAPPTGPKTPVTLHERLLEKRFALLLNDFRKRIGCDPVGWNEAVAARAREHAARMAEAGRRQHRFGTVGGVLDMLKLDGAGESGLSGPATPWSRLTSRRPFDRPAPQPPGPRVWNHVVVENLASDSLEEMFERFFVREAAFRICAADPNCVEIAVGTAREPRRQAPPPAKGKTSTVLPPGPLVYYCVCFVQVNETPTIRAQDDFFDDLVRRARAADPALLRALGMWGRREAADELGRALKDERPEVASAAFDGLLLLDEAKQRSAFERLAERRDEALKGRRYADAIALYEPLRLVQYDATIAAACARAIEDAKKLALAEIRELAAKPPEERASAAADLKRRTRGIGLDAEIDEALAKS